MSVQVRDLAQAALEGVREVLGTASERIALHEPELGPRESALVQSCLDSTFVSTVGEYVGRFESMLADYTGAKHAIVVVNGTAALHVALEIAGVRPGDEVLIPALSFVATANAVSHCRAIPHFVDSDTETMGMSPEALGAYLASITELTPEGAHNRKTGRRLAAIVPMHTFGHPVDMAALLAVAQRFEIPVVEDAAESLGSTLRNRHMGTFGVVASLSFNGNKIVTTGGGGAILTNDPELAVRAKHLTTTAKRAHRWEFFHDAVAWNYRLPNLNAALGCAQMERLPDFLVRKRALAERYKAAFSTLPGVGFVAEPPNTRSNYWLNTIRLETADVSMRDQVLETLNDAGYQARPVWMLLHGLPMYSESPCAPLPVATQLASSLINVPSSAKLGTPFV
jgi:perosamine synthetase